MKNLTNRGFTLIEMLLVISVIALVASIIIAALFTAKARAQDAQTVSYVHQFQTSFAISATNESPFPNTGDDTNYYCVGKLPSDTCSFWGLTLHGTTTLEQALNNPAFDSAVHPVVVINNTPFQGIVYKCKTGDFISGPTGSQCTGGALYWPQSQGTTCIVGERVFIGTGGIVCSQDAGTTGTKYVEAGNQSSGPNNNGNSDTGSSGDNGNQANNSTPPAMYAIDSGNNRAEAFDATGNYLFQFGGYGTGNGKLNRPWGIARDSDGNVYVTDTGNNRIEKFDSNGNYLSQFGTTGMGNGQLFTPRGIAIDPAGNIWVADTTNNRVQKFDHFGNYLLQIGSNYYSVITTDPGQMEHPGAVAVDHAGNVYVADTGNSRIEKFDSNGNFLIQFGGQGSGNGQMSQPIGVAIDNEGNVWVDDAINMRIEEFDSNGNYLSQFGTFGAGNGQFIPYGVAIDSDDNIWVSDGYSNRIQKFDHAGNYISQFGTAGSGGGQFDQFSQSPYGVTMVASSLAGGSLQPPVTYPAIVSAIADSQNGACIKPLTPYWGNSSMAIVGHYLIYASFGCDSVQSFDISDPKHPTLVSTLTNGTDGAKLTRAWAITTQGNYAYVSSLFDAAIDVIDISDPAHLRQVSYVDNNSPGFSGSNTLVALDALTISGHYLYATSMTNINPLTIIDISDPAHLQLKGSIIIYSLDHSVSWFQTAIAVKGNYVYTVGQILPYPSNSILDNLNVFDVSDPSNPYLAAQYRDNLLDNGDGGPDGIVFSWPTSLAIQGNYAYVAATAYCNCSEGGGLVTFDISNPTSPKLASYLRDGQNGAMLKGADKVVVSGNQAYVDALNGNDLQIIDITDPVHPVPMTALTTTNSYTISQPMELVLYGKYAYLVSLANSTLQTIQTTP